MLNDEIISIVSRFFDAGKGPSHDELTRMFKRAGLESKDPLEPGVTIGKMKRCREVLSLALDEDPVAGQKLVTMIIGSIKASGGFRSSSENYAGEEAIAIARRAFQNAGFDLDPEGNLRPLLLENLNGKNATEALYSYVRRARLGTEDAALVLGTGKDLLEATARHVLVQKTGSYPTATNFSMTLFQAFDRLNLSCPNLELIRHLDNENSVRAVEQALFLLGAAVNRLRNSEGSGHGRPYLSSISAEQARLATQALGIISEFLLSKLNSK